MEKPPEPSAPLEPADVAPLLVEAMERAIESAHAARDQFLRAREFFASAGMDRLAAACGVLVTAQEDFCFAAAEASAAFERQQRPPQEVN